MHNTRSMGSMLITSKSFAAMLVLLLSIQLSTVFAQSSTENTESFSNTVNVGGNGSNWDKFSPQNVTINAGDSITWSNPMDVPEPHTVTFLKDSKLIPSPVVPFSIPNNTEIIPVIPSSNAEPVIMPDPSNPNNKIVIMDNARSSIPVAIDSSGANVSYLPPNANYTVKGDESYINSGWMWPEGLSPTGAPPIYSLTLTFEKAGTYNYLCVIHPWMAGSVTVK